MIMEGLCPNCFASGFGGSSCGKCGYKAINYGENSLVLLPGTVLYKYYIVGKTLGMGGFGITYLGLDTRNNELCAIKEYFPAGLLMRKDDRMSVYSANTEMSSIIRHGLEVFVKEAQTLQSFYGTESIVQIKDFFSQNNTAYLVMEYLNGVTLHALKVNRGGKIPLDIAMQVVSSIAGTLNIVHKSGMLHRDVSPGNIFVTKQGDIKLIDFGSTRYFVGEKSRNLSVILKPGYAPPEQYSSKGNQGPWTDIYSLAASFYNITSGLSVPDAADRLSGVEMMDLNKLVSVSSSISNAIKKALELDYKKRYQTIEEFLADFNRRTRESGVEQGRSDTGGRAVEDEGRKKEDSRPDTGRGQSFQPPEKPAPVALSLNPYIKISAGELKDTKWNIPKNMDISIGRSAEQANIIVANQSVSKLHCKVKFDDKKQCFYVVDYSSNGTYLPDGQRMDRDRVYALAPKQFFYICSKNFMVEVGVE